jgi:hypothetical protein
MADQIDPPVFINIKGLWAWRYQKLTESLACFLKGVKIVSSLNACIVLLQAGCVQEIYALCRMINDYIDEIFFLLIPQDGEIFSKEQLQFLSDFFQEEFDEPANPLKSIQKRNNVPVQKIHATFGKIAKSEINPSDAQEMLRTIHKAYSGYVHGAYPHIMEMFGKKQPCLKGMLGTPRVDECREQLIGFVYKALIVSVFVARKLGLSGIENKARKLLEKFETDTDCKSVKSAKEILIKMKKN